jgi:hypothetical protein
VIFGPATTFADAFTFVMREIEEFPLEPLGYTGWWANGTDCWRFHLGHQPESMEAWITIEPGLRVGTWTAPDAETPRVACIAFDKSAGWDRAKAADWLQSQRPGQFDERTVFLQKPYRFAPKLAQFVQTIIRTNDWRQATTLGNGADARTWEFIPVPAVPQHGWPREGAGLELDLSGSRHADRLPVGLRQGLPASGFVNYLEAQALIRRLETWSEKECQGPMCKVAVLALYQGQVDLLRRLIEQSAILRARSFPLEIALPCQMKQRECDIVFLSMTRSHSHRATAFGEGVDELPIALTRASKRLFVFGDPGTLNRRTHWTGPVDQLDSHAASQELLRVKRLVACLQHANGNGKA